MFLYQIYSTVFPWAAKDYTVGADPVILPSGETIYENTYSKQVAAEMQANADYRYSAARFPNPKNYTLPFYDRNNIYAPESTGPLFTTSPNLNTSQSKQSTLTGMPMQMTHTNMSEQRRRVKQFDLLPDSYGARKFENLSGQSELFFPKQEVTWDAIHDTQPQFANGTPVYPDSFLERAKDGFLEQNEGTNLLPIPKISVSAAKEGTLRIIPRNVDELRAETQPKVSELHGVLTGESSMTQGGFLTLAPQGPIRRPKNSGYNHSTNTDLDSLFGGNYWKPVNEKKPRTKAYKQNYLGPSTDTNVERNILDLVQTKAVPKKKEFGYVSNANVTSTGMISRETMMSREKVDEVITPYIGNAFYSNGSYSRDSETFRENKKNTMSGHTEFLPLPGLANSNELFYEGISDTKDKYEHLGRFNMGGIATDERILNGNRTHRTESSEFSRILDTPFAPDTFNRKITSAGNENVVYK